MDFYDTTENKLRLAGHEPGPQCRCSECNRLKRVEDKWILRMGTFHGDYGLNTRDEFTAVERGNYRNGFNFVNYFFNYVLECAETPREI